MKSILSNYNKKIVIKWVKMKQHLVNLAVKITLSDTMSIATDKMLCSLFVHKYQQKEECFVLLFSLLCLPPSGHIENRLIKHIVAYVKTHLLGNS